MQAMTAGNTLIVVRRFTKKNQQGITNIEYKSQIILHPNIIIIYFENQTTLILAIHPNTGRTHECLVFERYG
jgi:hypothetical protein